MRLYDRLLRCAGWKYEGELCHGDGSTGAVWVSFLHVWPANCESGKTWTSLSIVNTVNSEKERLGSIAWVVKGWHEHFSAFFLPHEFASLSAMIHIFLIAAFHSLHLDIAIPTSAAL